MIYVAGPVDDLAEVVDRIGQERGLRRDVARFRLANYFDVLKMLEEREIDASKAKRDIQNSEFTFGVLHRIKLDVDVFGEYDLKGRSFIRYFPNNSGFPEADYEDDFQLIRETFEKVLASLE